MGKPYQASEAQLNAWISSLSSSGDLLATKAVRHQSAETKRQTRKSPKRQREDKSKPDVAIVGANKRVKASDSKAVLKHKNAFEEAMDENTTVENGATKLTALSLLVQSASKLNRIEKQRERYAPGKAPSASVSKRKLNLQPRKSDYGGIGLARPSLWIPLDESGWRRKLNKNFEEHIPGFSGKHRTKAMKKRLNGDMLWRQRLARKQSKDEKAVISL